MDFFGGLTDLLDTVLPDSDDIVGVLDEASSLLLGDRKNKSAGDVSDTSKIQPFQSKLNPYELDDFEAMAIGQGIAKSMNKSEPLESVDPRAVQANWMSRLSTFASDSPSEQKLIEKMVKKTIQKQV